MKFSAALALIVVVGLVASSSALPAKKRMVYMQAQPQWYGAPQRMMYVQYVQPSRTHARSTQAASALVAGESVATGTYLNEADIAAAGPVVEAEEPQQGEDALEAAGAHSTQAVAEAYPDEELQTPLVETEVAAEEPVAVEEEAEDTDAKVPRDYHFDAEAEVDAAAAADADSAAAAEAEGEGEVEVEAEAPVAAVVPAVEVAADLPAPAPIAPVAKPARRYLPANKKVYVELEQSAEADEEEEDETNEAAVADAEEDDEAEEEEVAPVAPVNPVRVPNARRPTKKAAAKPSKPAKAAAPAKPSKPSKPLPAGSFFPINFGGTSGGAIAIANSFSTGEGGSATSHAIAYGSPDAARARVRPSKFH